MLCKTSGDDRNPITFLFFNGFGSDYSYWDNLLPYFQNYNCVMASDDYFIGNILHLQPEALLKDRYLIGVGHSLGYEKLCLLQEQEPYIKLQKIISISGFSHYLGKDPILQPHRKAPLEMMKKCYAVNAFWTLAWFQMFCGQTVPYIPGAINEERFFADLKLLDSGIKSPDIPHLVLSSIDDYVIPFYITEDNFRRLPDVEIHYTNGAGHLLGMRQAAWVYQKIINFALNGLDLPVRG